ncbi:MAG: hypothetical protein BRD35_07600, partial [Bacteroidetes bacterium QH_7_62_13]
MPPEAEVMLIGDGEFHSIDLLRAARQKGSGYCIRLHADTYLRTSICERARESRGGNAGPWIQTRES